MKTFFYKDQGVSSVLIVIMMIVLMIFGLAGITLSISNNRLADKKIDWLSEYYLLEGDANKTIAQIDEVITTANNKDAMLADIKAINAEKDLTIDVKNTQDDDYLISFTAEKNAEYPRYIDVVLNAKKDSNGTYSIIIERFKQRQAPFDYGTIFQFD